MNIERTWAMPNNSTFSIKPIFQFINSIIKTYDEPKIIVDPFSRYSPFKHISITNDLDTEIDADYHMDALDFLRTIESNSVDIVLFDPPYSLRQVSECYKKMGRTVNSETTRSTFWTNMKVEISRVVKSGGSCISFGWNSGGVGKKLGFSIENILLVAHGGWHNDTICTHEIKS